MRLLITTQAVDENDLYLGFFCGWLTEFSKHFERITVICLKEGKHNLPANVEVLSLGKEYNSSRLTRVVRFFKYIRAKKDNYDAVFVHMNEEYILLAGWLWKRWNKKIYMWRNHYQGSRRTDKAASYCAKVFCTSKFSYTAKYPKTVLMPVGVDTSIYCRLPEVPRDPRSILFYARLAPSKKPDLLVEALGVLKQRGASFAADIYGTPLPQDEKFYEKIKSRAQELTLDGQITFLPGAPHSEGPRIFNAHSIYVDISASGMYNKTLFEAAACECIVVTASQDFAALVDDRFVYHERGAEELADKLQALLKLSVLDRQAAGAQLHNVAKEHSLEALGAKLAQEIYY